MSEIHFDNALNALQKHYSSCNSRLLKILVAIRKEVEWPKNRDNITKLRGKGCLKQIVACLQTTQKNELDVCLSILGNCCMEKGCTSDLVRQFNILHALNTTLKKFPKNDSVNGRVFRIIGNICQHKDHQMDVVHIVIDRNPQIVNHMVEIIKKVGKDEVPTDEKVSEATIMMAIRSLRALLNCQSVIELVKGFGVLKAIGLLLIKYSTDWQETKKHENLLNNIIRLLQEYSRYKYYNSIMEMRNTEKGDSLVQLSSVLLLAPKRVVKIVMNFIRISRLKSDLPIPEICDRFIEVFKNNSIVKEFNGECVEYLQCLCYLLEHPANRSRCRNCIPLLIQLLRDFKEPSNIVLECCILIIAALNNCKYDDSLLLDQLNIKIVEVLIEKLHWLVGNSKILNTSHVCENKRKYHVNNSCNNLRPKRFALEYEELRKPKSPVSSDDEFDFISYQRLVRSPSPASSSESDLYSWSSPGPSSPKSQILDVSESDSDDYSPVCSEADPTEFPPSPPREDDDEMPPPDQDRCSEKDECEEHPDMEGNFSDKVMSSNLKMRLLTETAKLLKTYTKLKPPPLQLGSEELLLALMKSSGHFDWTYASRVDTVDIVCRILDSHDYLIPLMQTDFIQNVFDLTEPQHGIWCTRCNHYQHVGQTVLRKFTGLAESGVGKGDIAHKLLRGDNLTKQKLVLVIPYVVTNRSILGKLMLNCGGLEILMKLLRNNRDSLEKRRSIKVLCAMASRKLAIANPKHVAMGLTRPKIIADKYKLSESCQNIVTFMLDNGALIKADRDFLSERSDYFNSLLNGNFKESTEDVISLQNVKLKPLRCLFHLLECLDKNETIDIDLDLHTLLDIIVLCDRYLMSDMCVSLTHSVELFRMSEVTVPDIYKWSIESGTNLLRIESIAFALVANVKDSGRFVMFHSLFSLGYSEQLVEDIQKLLVRYLTLE